MLVDVAYLAPAQCMFTKSANGPFIDFGRDFDFDHAGRMYAKVSYIEELAEEFGSMVPRRALADAEARIGELELEVAAERARADGAEACFEAIDQLESAGMRARRRQGRPKTKKAEVVA